MLTRENIRLIARAPLYTAYYLIFATGVRTVNIGSLNVLLLF